MKKLIIAGLAISAAFMVSGRAHAYVSYPWCAIGEGRGIDCYFASREQCAADGRGRGFGGQCILNPGYTGPAVRGRMIRRHHRVSIG
jgi:hypothetical protein